MWGTLVILSQITISLIFRNSQSVARVTGRARPLQAVWELRSLVANVLVSYFDNSSCNVGFVIDKATWREIFTALSLASLCSLIWPLVPHNLIILSHIRAIHNLHSRLVPVLFNDALLTREEATVACFEATPPKFGRSDYTTLYARKRNTSSKICTVV